MITVNGHKLVPTMFPDGTSQVWKLPGSVFRCGGMAKIEWRFGHEGEIMHLAQLKRLLDARSINATLYMPFLPYSRQDHGVSNESTFALLAFAGIINRLKFISVYCLDAHSSQASKSIENFHSHYPKEVLHHVLSVLGDPLVCFPDAGAVAKYSGFVEKFLYGQKKRNQSTGEIEEYSLTHSKCEANVLIVDDICDGGATFIELARLLRGAGAEQIHLFVTHGIFSKGLMPLRAAGIDRIFTHEGEISETRGEHAICIDYFENQEAK